MPGGDETGPMGAGPMTGRARGYCAGFDAPGFANTMPGRGFGFGRRWRGGRGFGRGFRGGRGFGFQGGRGFRGGAGYAQPYPAYEPVTEPVALSKEEQKKILEAELNDIEAETKDIEAEKQEIKKKIKELSKKDA